MYSSHDQKSTATIKGGRQLSTHRREKPRSLTLPPQITFEWKRGHNIIYQGRGVGAVNAKDADGGLAVVGSSGGGVGSHRSRSDGDGALRSSGSDGADHLAGEHRELTCARCVLGGN